MNLGKVNVENEKFLNDYKKFGYKTKTHLTNDAIQLLRKKKEEEARQKWIADAFSEIKGLEPDCAFEELDGEDFESR